MTGRKLVGAMTFALLPALMIVGNAGTAAAPTTRDAVRPAVASTVPAVCRAPARRGFWPLRANAQRVRKGIPVIPVGRTHGVPNSPPLTSSGKNSFGWDHRGPAPGSRHGNVRFNAHTYPDGSALGNRMLARLVVGARIIVRGANGVGICYRVTRRISVTPRSYAARVGYYNTTGKPKLAIVVCSGTRLGPGNWTRRTIWYAKPSTT